MKKIIFISTSFLLLLGSCLSERQATLPEPKFEEKEGSVFFTDSTVDYYEDQKPTTTQKSKAISTKAQKKVKTKKQPIRIRFNATQEYIHKFKKVAIEEHKIYKIPASITLAQGLLESGRGQSTLTKRDNAHFGIKPGPWAGAKKLYITKEWDKNLQKFVEVKDYFRVYPSAWWSFRNRSHFLTKTARYKPCFKCGDDYKCWAKQLSKCGYATDPHYSKTLIKLIETYELYKFDQKKGFFRNSL